MTIFIRFSGVNIGGMYAQGVMNCVWREYREKGGLEKGQKTAYVLCVHVPQARSLKLPRIRGKLTHLFKELQYLFPSTTGEVSGEFPQPLQALQGRGFCFRALVAHVEVVVVFGEVGV